MVGGYTEDLAKSSKLGCGLSAGGTTLVITGQSINKRVQVLAKLNYMPGTYFQLRLCKSVLAVVG